MVKIYPSMCRRIFGNVFKLTGHNLVNTEYPTEFQIICSKVPFAPFTPQLLFQIIIALFCVNLSNNGATLHQKMTQTGKHGIFRGIFSKVLKLIPNYSKWLKYKPPCVGGCLDMEGYIQTIWNSLEAVLRLLKNLRERFLVFQIVSFFGEAWLQCSSNSYRTQL